MWHPLPTELPTHHASTHQSEPGCQQAYAHRAAKVWDHTGLAGSHFPEERSLSFLHQRWPHVWLSWGHQPDPVGRSRANLQCIWNSNAKWPFLRIWGFWLWKGQKRAETLYFDPWSQADFASPNPSNICMFLWLNTVGYPLIRIFGLPGFVRIKGGAGLRGGALNLSKFLCLFRDSCCFSCWTHIYNTRVQLDTVNSSKIFWIMPSALGGDRHLACLEQ